MTREYCLILYVFFREHASSFNGRTTIRTVGEEGLYAHTSPFDQFLLFSAHCFVAETASSKYHVRTYAHWRLRSIGLVVMNHNREDRV